MCHGAGGRLRRLLHRVPPKRAPPPQLPPHTLTSHPLAPPPPHQSDDVERTTWRWPITQGFALVTSHGVCMLFLVMDLFLGAVPIPGSHIGVTFAVGLFYCIFNSVYLHYATRAALASNSTAALTDIQIFQESPDDGTTMDGNLISGFATLITLLSSLVICHFFGSGLDLLRLKLWSVRHSVGRLNKAGRRMAMLAAGKDGNGQFDEDAGAPGKKRPLGKQGALN